MPRVANRMVLRIEDGVARQQPDELAGEEPLEMRVAGRPIAVTMRTPGHDFELVAGFLWTEGLLSQPGDLAGLRYCTPAGEDQNYNVIDVDLRAGVPDLTEGRERSFYTTSSCGVCGKASIDAVTVRGPFDVAGDPLRLEPGDLASLPDRLRAAQKVFDRTGGLHAAGLFGADGEVLCLREDVGRHNAVDKVVGWAITEHRLPLVGCTLMVSGRASFELVQKALMAGVPALAAVSAPSSLAVELADESGMTLIGFLRGNSMNVYAGAHRIVTEGPV
jgi:FdhD protein